MPPFPVINYSRSSAATKIAEFAKKLGISETSAPSGLQDALPNVIDKASPNGSLMDIGEQLLKGLVVCRRNWQIVWAKNLKWMVAIKEGVQVRHESAWPARFYA